MRAYYLLATAALLAAVGGLGWKIDSDLREQARRDAAQQLQGLTFSPYAAQKVVYHVAMSGGLFDRAYLDVLGSLANHVRAVGAGNLDARVVLQADGLGLLQHATSNAHLRSAIDSLRASGVKFEVCRNSMLSRGVTPDSLYGLQREDIVAAGVAEVSALEGRGYVYVRF